MTKDDYIKELETALLPFANAHARLRHFGDEPGDDTEVQVIDEVGCLFELFADAGEDQGKVPTELLMVGHLANAARFFNGGESVRKFHNE